MILITKEVKIGFVVIVAIALLFCGINFLKGTSLFQKNKLYYISFNNISGLAESNPVYANGFRIGTVRTIDYDYDHPGNVYVGVEVDDDIRISEGSYAELDAQMLGGVTMNIVLGSSPRVLSPGDTIKGGPRLGALDRVEQMMPQLQTIMPKLDSILSSVNNLLANPALQQTLSNTAELTAQLKETTTRVNTLMSGDVQLMLANLKPATQNLKSLTDKLAKIDYEGFVTSASNTMEELQLVTTSLNNTINMTLNCMNSPNSSLGLLLNDASLYHNLNRNLISSDSLLNDLRLHPKRYVHFSVFGNKNK